LQRPWRRGRAGTKCGTTGPRIETPVLGTRVLLLAILSGRLCQTQFRLLPLAAEGIPENLKAAALVHGIVADHGFVDGNKRTALYLVELMVERSGYEFIEHDMAFIRAVADRVTVLARGSLLADGTVAEVENAPEVVAVYGGVDR